MFRLSAFAFLVFSLPLLCGADLPESLQKAFTVPKEYQGKMGNYRDLLIDPDGKKITDAKGWEKQRERLKADWMERLGAWPELVAKPKVEILESKAMEGYTRSQLRLQIAPDRTTEDAYLLTPKGKGPFPAVVVVFYDGKTGIGEGKKTQRDFALQLVKRGFVALSMGSDPNTYYPNKEKATIQPLSFHAYVAANAYNALANMPNVDAKKIGVVGHSYGGKWSMFAGAFYEKFAAVATSDPGIVFDEARSNINYWEPWYLGYETGKTRKPGIPKADNPRTGPYAKLIEDKRDLHEIHALIAPRPFFVSGGAEDSVERWVPLNHLVGINKLLGVEKRVGMTNRPMHDPNEESNKQLCDFFEYFLK